MSTTIAKLLDNAIELPLLALIEIAGSMRRITDPECIAAEHQVLPELIDLLAELSDFVRDAERLALAKFNGYFVDRVFDDSVECGILEQSKPRTDLDRAKFLAIQAFGKAWAGMYRNAEPDVVLNYRIRLEQACLEYEIMIGEHVDRKAAFLLYFCRLSIIGVLLPA